MKQSKLGLIGLGTMGKALSRNLASRGYRVSLWNRTTEKITDFVKEFGEEQFYAPTSFEDFIESLERPRKIIVMLPANKPSQEMFSRLAMVLEPGDCVMDGANAVFKVTEINQRHFAEAEIQFLGAGISGGEEGALKGPSIMPGGSVQAWESFEKILHDIAAEDFSGGRCVAYMGKSGAGHYVKMVHNGIEYAEMQALAEAYELLRQLYKLPHEEIAEIFKRWNAGPLASYLTEISVDVLQKKEDGKDLLDLILDKAKQKGTGRWTSQDALDLGVPTPSITGAVFMRGISMDKETREELAENYPLEVKSPTMTISEFTDHLEQALIGTRLSNFEQGFALLREANTEHNFELNMPEIVRVWQGGCIIRNQMLKDMHTVFKAKPTQSLYGSEFGVQALRKAQKSWRLVTQIAMQHGVPALAISNALLHFDAYRRPRSSANFLQGLRDRFGSHGYERVDQEGNFHSNWT